MKFTFDDDHNNAVRRYVIEFSAFEMATAQFSSLDLALMRESNISTKVSDRLLALEMIASRIEEAATPVTSSLTTDEPKGRITPLFPQLDLEP